MKLYATTRNKSASKGIGDDAMLLTTLAHGNKIICTMRLTLIEGAPYLDIEINGVWHEIALDRQKAHAK